MRSQLAMRSLAVSSLLVLAFVVPLGALVRSAAQDGADDQARADVASLIPVVAVTNDPTVIEAAAATTITGQAQNLAVATTDQLLLGSSRSTAVEQALDQARSFTTETNGDLEIIRVVQTANSGLTAISATVPSEQRLQGVTSAWLILGGSGLTMILIGVFATDRLGRSVVRDIEELSAAATQLGDGDLTTRVDPAGSDELQRLGVTFNLLGSQVEDMINRERGTIAAMSHRLRTPLTRLRLRVDQVSDPELADALRQDLDDTTSELTQMIQETRRSIDQRSQSDTTCDAAQIIRERLQFWGVLATEQGRSVIAHIPTEPLNVQLDPTTLIEITDILLDNVFTHSLKGSDLTVTLETVPPAHARLTIANEHQPGSRAAGSGMGHKIIAHRLQQVHGSIHTTQTETSFTAQATMKHA